MARIIEFYIPEKYRPKARPMVSITRGKVIELPVRSVQQPA